MPCAEGSGNRRPSDSSIERARAVLNEADRVIIGAGAGLSAAAGLTYSGGRFERLFRPFIDRYGMTDMYSAGFYPFETEEDRWAYWAQHVWANRFDPGATRLYQDILSWAQSRDWFVLTTNVDAQFELAGFDGDRIFATQGDYALMQCRRGCHPRTYRNDEAVAAIRADIGATDGAPLRTRVSDGGLLPRCPVCGGPMDVHLRCDGSFVEDADWKASQRRYARFVEESVDRRTVLLELGVGWNTPVWIRFPFERFACQTGAVLVRINADPITADASQIPGAVGLAGDISEIWRRVARPR